MSKYSKLDVIDRFSSSYIKNGPEHDKAAETTLKAYDRQRMCRTLYNDGFSWYKNNNLEDATEVFDFDGEKKPKKDIVHFQRGYQQAAKQTGFEYGLKETALETLPEKYTNDKYFLEGYKKGIETVKKEMEKGNKTK